MRVLIVEDDPQIATGLARALRASGNAVDALADGREAETALAGQQYDLIILDLGLPGLDGFGLLRRLRSMQLHVPVLVLTARDELADRVRGLDLGADDYMVKPFELAELEARMRAIARRAIANRGGDIGLGGLCLRMAQRQVEVDGLRVDLSPREFSVLEILLLRHGRVVSKSQLQEHLCDWSQELSDGAIELYVHRLRKKIENSGVELRTVRGFGYLLQAQADRV